MHHSIPGAHLSRQGVLLTISIYSIEVSKETRSDHGLLFS